MHVRRTERIVRIGTVKPRLERSAGRQIPSDSENSNRKHVAIIMAECFVLKGDKRDQNYG